MMNVYTENDITNMPVYMVICQAEHSAEHGGFLYRTIQYGAESAGDPTSESKKNPKRIEAEKAAKALNRPLYETTLNNLKNKKQAVEDEINRRRKKDGNIGITGSEIYQTFKTGPYSSEEVHKDLAKRKDLNDLENQKLDLERQIKAEEEKNAAKEALAKKLAEEGIS